MEITCAGLGHDHDDQSDQNHHDAYLKPATNIALEVITPGHSSNHLNHIQ